MAGLRFKVSLKLMFLIKILVQSLGRRVLTLVNQPAQMVVTGLVDRVDLEVKSFRVINTEAALKPPLPHDFINHVEAVSGHLSRTQMFEWICFIID